MHLQPMFCLSQPPLCNRMLGSNTFTWEEMALKANQDLVL